MMASPPHIAITGSGPVSLACALLLVRRGCGPGRIWLESEPGPLPAALAARALAISHGSRQLLERIVRFPAAGRIGSVDVSISGHAGRTRITALDMGVPALGHVVRYDGLMQALRDAVARHAWAQDAVAPSIVVHADGDPGQRAHSREFGQCALLGEVATPDAGDATAEIAYERFADAGPLALLPLPEPRRRSLVWCDTAARCAERIALGPDELQAALQQRFGTALGRLQLDGPLAIAPLTRRIRRDRVQPGAVWIGNAAQTLHPVAGQGLNLGLRDAFELAAVLGDADRRGEALQAALYGYHRRRRTDRSITVALTDLMAGSFTWPLARPLQSPFLAALDLAPALRRPLASQLLYGWR